MEERLDKLSQRMEELSAKQDAMMRLLERLVEKKEATEPKALEPSEEEKFKARLQRLVDLEIEHRELQEAWTHAHKRQVFWKYAFNLTQAQDRCH